MRIDASFLLAEKMTEKVKDSATLRFLYNTVAGRIILKLLTACWVSKLCGAYLNSKLSKPLIKRFVKNNNIDLNEYHSDSFRCFNDCFCRKIKDGLRPIPDDESIVFAPCDGLLSAYQIKEDMVIPVKQSEYSVSSLLNDSELSKVYKDGICLVFRLCVNHYHRYSYCVSGEKGNNIFIKGRLHTVRPIALRSRPVFTENCREYTVIENDRFGKVLQMEVGAMLVGKIANLQENGFVTRGEEKGMFLYGGSTIIVLFEKDKANINQRFFDATENDIETPVKLGESLM